MLESQSPYHHLLRIFLPVKGATKKQDCFTTQGKNIGALHLTGRANSGWKLLTLLKEWQRRDQKVENIFH